jgi:antitoxin (DNA-binding transcriptional repressor) of toxin-antitoxin stability system
MTQANMHEAKSKLSQLAELAHSGQVVVIAKAGKPYVDLVPHKERKHRKPGGYTVDMSRFDEADNQIESDFYGTA